MNMKKIFKNILASALTIAAVASCVDDRNNFLPDDSFGFNNKAGENVLTLPLYGGSYDIDVIKSGKGWSFAFARDSNCLGSRGIWEQSPCGLAKGRKFQYG